MYRTIPLTLMMILALLWTACAPPQVPEPDTAVTAVTPVAVESAEAGATALVETVSPAPPAIEASRPPPVTPTPELPTPTSVPALPDPTSGISLALEDVAYEADQTTIFLTLNVADGSGPEARGASLGQMRLFDDAGNEYQATLGSGRSENTPEGLVTEISQTFEPGLWPEAQRLTLQTGILLHWAAVEPIILDLREREVGDRWPVNQTVEIYGVQLPIEEAALASNPDAPPDSLTIQLFAPCVEENGVRFTYLELLVSEGQQTGSGPGDSNCQQGEQLIASTTVAALLDGGPPSALETATLHLVAHIELPGPWELSWDVLK